MEKIIRDLNLGRFKYSIDKSKLILNDDGTFDYNGELDFRQMKLKSLLKLPIKLRSIYGNFLCSNNQLISLQGAPKFVNGDFWCHENHLISLQYAPPYVGMYFYCDGNFLLSKVHLSEVGVVFHYGKTSFSITNSVIESVKQMTSEQQMSELDFFLKYDKKAYKMLLDVLDGLGLSVIEKRKEMLDHTDSLDIGHLL